MYEVKVIMSYLKIYTFDRPGVAKLFYKQLCSSLSD